MVRSNWAEIRFRAKKISNALIGEGIEAGDRVATLAMNTADHVAAWFGITGIGAVCHTLNPRLSSDQLHYIINHAEDRIIFADSEFKPLLSEIDRQCPSVDKLVWFDDDGADGLEMFLSRQSHECEWGLFDECSPAGLCYTSGTTGSPKGVLYTHRSNYLHTLMLLQPDVFNMSNRDIWLPAVPMFHANGWGLIHAAAAVGAKLVLPGRHLDGKSLHHIMSTEKVTSTAGVPTVWQTLLAYLDENNLKLDDLARVLIGGAACSQVLYQDFERRGITVQHNWGMTETSPLGTAGSLTRDLSALQTEEQLHYRLKQGRAPVGVDVRIVGEKQDELPHDGRTPGLLQVRGHSVVDTYYRADHTALDDEGFFDTGDIATIDRYGFVQITDRAKDVIKSGGEWISSVDMENAVLSHPGVELAAVIGIADSKWGERPLLLVKPKADRVIAEAEIRDVLAVSFARWELPETICFVEHIALGATGKIDKKALRERFAVGGINALQNE